MLAIRDQNGITSSLVIGAHGRSSLSIYSPSLDRIATNASGTGAICPITNHDNSIQLAGIHLLDDVPYFIVHDIPQLNEIYRMRLGIIGTVFTMTPFINPNNEFGHTYMLTISYDGLVGVIDLNERSFLGLIYQIRQGIYWGNFDNFDQDDDLELAVLSSDAFIVYDIEPLNVAFSSGIPHPSSIVLSTFPNPFNSSTTISYSLPKPGRFAVDVVDVSGRLVTRLSSGWKEAGSYREIWEGNRLTSGQYVLRLKSADETFSRPITIIK